MWCDTLHSITKQFPVPGPQGQVHGPYKRECVGLAGLSPDKTKPAVLSISACVRALLLSPGPLHGRLFSQPLSTGHSPFPLENWPSVSLPEANFLTSAALLHPDHFPFLPAFLTAPCGLSSSFAPTLPSTVTLLAGSLMFYLQRLTTGNTQEMLGGWGPGQAGPQSVSSHHMPTRLSTAPKSRAATSLWMQLEVTQA